MAKFFVLLVAFAIIAQVSMTSLPLHDCDCGSRVNLESLRGLLNHGGRLTHQTVIGQKHTIVERRPSLQPIREIERVHSPIYQNPAQSKVIGYWPINNKAYGCGDRYRIIISPPAYSC